MKISLLDGEKLYYAFFYGKKEVLKKKKHLNEINVFPVADGDTGTNLVLTMQSIFDGAPMKSSIPEVSKDMAEAALVGSRGNSGIIFAQFLHGLSDAVGDRKVLNVGEFVHAVRQAVEHAYKAISKPVEGTILTVMRAWANRLHALHEKTDDFKDLLNHSIAAAKKSLHETPLKLKVLREAGVVDAGAQGFVHFLEGIASFLRHGRKPELDADAVAELEMEDAYAEAIDQEMRFRYCTEGLLKGESIDTEEVRSIASEFGDSLIVAGSKQRAKIHIHTDRPADLFFRLRHLGDIVHQKVDDMHRIRDVHFHRKSSIALVTDSTCDLPQAMMDAYQIHMVLTTITVGNSQFIDKLTLTPHQFYSLLDESEEVPKTSQPSVKAFENLYAYLTSRYDSVISMHLSKALSGTYEAAKSAAAKFSGKKISVINSRHLSSSLGLMVLRVAQEISGQKSHEDIVGFAESLPDKAKLFVCVKTLKYLVRGGRVSPMKGGLAKLLHVKPIISLNKEGASTFIAKAFNSEGVIKKILRMIREYHKQTPVGSFAVGHANAEGDAVMLGERVQKILGKAPSFIIDVSPVIGSHAGTGALSVSFLSE